PDLNPKKDTVVALEECSAAGGGAATDQATPVQRQGQHEGRTGRTPRTDSGDAADWLRHDLGVSKSLWGEACVAMGRKEAAIALAIVSTKPAEHFRTTPGGYFHGMVAKAKA